MTMPQQFSETLGRPMQPYSEDLDVRVTDSSLRDGSHAKRHQFTLEHVTDIVRNAEVFRERWGATPMLGWLEAFEERGLVRRDERGRWLTRA